MRFARRRGTPNSGGSSGLQRPVFPPSSTRCAMDEIPICPEWWPAMLWKLHFPTRRPGPSPGPINYPPAIDSIMASLTIHTLSYMLLDQDEAQKFRDLAEKNLSITTGDLSRYHVAGVTSTNRFRPEDSLGNTGGRTPP